MSITKLIHVLNQYLKIPKIMYLTNYSMIINKNNYVNVDYSTKPVKVNNKNKEINVHLVQI
jgi:hypothetical protein